MMTTESSEKLEEFWWISTKPQNFGIRSKVRVSLTVVLRNLVIAGSGMKGLALSKNTSIF